MRPLAFSTLSGPSSAGVRGADVYGSRDDGREYYFVISLSRYHNTRRRVQRRLKLVLPVTKYVIGK